MASRTSSLSPARHLDISTAAEYTVRFAFSFLLGRLRIMNSFAPFGVAFVGASPQGPAGLLSLVGMCLGALAGGTLTWALKYIAAAVLVKASIHFFADTLPRLFPLAVTFAITAVIGFVYAWDTHFEVTATATYVVETFAASGLVFFYDAALAPWGQDRAPRAAHTAGAVILLASVFMSLASIELFGVLSIGRCAAAVFIMFVIYRGGMAPGCVCAAILGAALDLAQGGLPFFTMALTLAAVISGVFSKSGRVIFVLSWTASAALAVLWFWRWHIWTSLLYESFAASVIFTLIPEGALARAAVLLPTDTSGLGFLKAREYTRDRVKLCAEAFSCLYQTVRGLTGAADSDDPAEIYDRAADTVCKKCANAARCWQEDYVETVDVMNHLTPVFAERGAAGLEDLPEHFRSACSHPARLMEALNSEARSYRMRRQFHSRLRENRVAAFAQYADVSGILSSFAQELGGEITVEPDLERRLQKYLRGLAIQASAAVFRLRGGRLRAEIRSQDLHLLRRDANHLDKLSAVLGMRLCTAPSGDDNRMILLEAEPLAVCLGAAGAKKTGEDVSGDRSVSFRTDEGYLYVALSDGMGTGPEAARLSESSVGILERFLRAGVEPELTLKLLSDLMLLRNDTELETATVDLLKLNMFSGASELYKSGAAPSYLKRGAAVKRLAAAPSIPAGFRLDSRRRCAAKISMSPDTVLIMVSDGVVTGRDDKWLRDIASSYQGRDMAELSKLILSAATARTGAGDDMTVLALRVEQRA